MRQTTCSGQHVLACSGYMKRTACNRPHATCNTRHIHTTPNRQRTALHQAGYVQWVHKRSQHVCTVQNTPCNMQQTTCNMHQTACHRQHAAGVPRAHLSRDPRVLRPGEPAPHGCDGVSIPASGPYGYSLVLSVAVMAGREEVAAACASSRRGPVGARRPRPALGEESPAAAGAVRRCDAMRCEAWARQAQVRITLLRVPITLLRVRIALLRVRITLLRVRITLLKRGAIRYGQAALLPQRVAHA